MGAECNTPKIILIIYIKPLFNIMLYNKHSQLYISIILLLIFYLVSWPFYKYMLDPDGACYAAIAEQYAEGHIYEAVNGLWSPLHGWLIIPLIKFGIYTPYAFKISNLLIGTGILITVHQYLIKSTIDQTLQRSILFSLVVFISYLICHELAADLPFCLAIIIYFKITHSKDFYDSRKKNILAGLVGGLAFLAKAVGFPFFLIHFALIHFWKRFSLRDKKYYLAGLLTFFLIATPWIIALAVKYSQWMYSGSGLLNMSWLLNPVKSEHIVFFPPPHKHAYSFWEDPWYMQDKFNSPFDSLNHFTTLFKQILHNIQDAIKSLLHISFLAPAICVAGLYNLLREPSKEHFFVLISTLLLPAGYLLFHYEDRFLWPVYILIMITGVYYFNYLLKLSLLKKWQRMLLWTIYFGSFVIEPVNQLKDALHFNKNEYDLASLMRRHHITGSFASNKRRSECGIIAYINRQKYYWPNKTNKTDPELIRCAKKDNIEYFLFFHEKKQDKECLINSLSKDDFQSVVELNQQTLAFKL